MEAGKLTIQGALRQMSGKSAKGDAGAPSQETEATRIAAVVIGELAKIEDDDIHVFEVMTRVQEYVDNRMRQVAARTKSNTVRDPVPEDQLPLFEE